VFVCECIRVTRLSEHLQETFDAGPDEDIRMKKGGGDDEGPGGEGDHPEPEIDEMRSQRDVILKRYIQVSSREEKRREELRSMFMGGV
jgi:hypothetical protein